jgi:hypothetical protein
MKLGSRDTLFNNPQIIPTDDINPSYGPLIPLCRELVTDVGRIDAIFINERGAAPYRFVAIVMPVKTRT